MKPLLCLVVIAFTICLSCQARTITLPLSLAITSCLLKRFAFLILEGSPLLQRNVQTVWIF